MAEHLNLSHHLTHTFTVDTSHNLSGGRVGIRMVLQASQKPGRRGGIIQSIEETYLSSEIPPKDMEKFVIYRALRIRSDIL